MACNVNVQGSVQCPLMSKMALVDCYMCINTIHTINTCLLLTLKCKYSVLTIVRCSLCFLPWSSHEGRFRTQPSRTQASPSHSPYLSQYKACQHSFLHPPHDSLSLLLISLVHSETIAAFDTALGAEDGGGHLLQ